MRPLQRLTLAEEVHEESVTLLSEYTRAGICADLLVKYFEMFWSERHSINKFFIYLTVFALGFDL